MPSGNIVILPANTCQTKSMDGKSIYWTDYCARHRIRKRSKSSMRPRKALYVDTNTVRHLILGDHYDALPMGYSQRKFNDTLTGLRQKMGDMSVSSGKKQTFSTIANEQDIKQQSDIPFSDQLPDTLAQIEQAWVEEVDASKRDRGRIYGNAGKKMNTHYKQVPDTEKKSLPGLKNWLDTANEYEKQVVHNFVSTVAANLDDAPEQVPMERPSLENKSKIPANKSVRIHTPSTKSECLLPSRKTKSADSARPRAPSPGHQRAQSADNDRPGTSCSVVSLDLKNASTQVPPATYEDTLRQRTVSAPAVPVKSHNSRRPTYRHSCTHCDVCMKKEVKRMLDNYAEEKPKTLEQLIEENKRQPEPAYASMYQSRDYVDPAASFHRVNARHRGYFIIHPDFVSEYGGIRQSVKENKHHIIK